MGTGGVFLCMELQYDEECKWIVCGFWVGWEDSTIQRTKVEYIFCCF